MKFVTLFALLLLSACGGADNKSAAELTRLGTEVTKLNAAVTGLNTQLDGLRGSYIKLIIDSPHDSATFDPQENPSYQAVTSPTGRVLIVLEKVEPYLDGFTISLRIGNTSSATYTGIKGKVSWGRKFDFQKVEEYNQLSEKELNLVDVLPPGIWTNVKFNIAPAKSEEVRRIVIKPVFDTISLRGSSN